VPRHDIGLRRTPDHTDIGDSALASQKDDSQDDIFTQSITPKSHIGIMMGFETRLLPHNVSRSLWASFRSVETAYGEDGNQQARSSGPCRACARLFRDIFDQRCFPGLAIFFTVFAFNVLGDGWRDIFSPRGSQ